MKIPFTGWNIGEDEPVFVVAEVAQAHDGSLGAAHAYIDAVAAAGANAIKFQTHIASAESTPSEPWRVAFSRQDQSRYDYWKRMEFTEDQWSGLVQHAGEVGLVFLSSPFSVEAVALLERVGIPAWKVAAGEMGSFDLMDAMIATRKPILFSTGMCSWAELDVSVARVRNAKLPFGIYQCTSAYPCPPETWGLNVLGELRDRYGCPVGLSDHSGAMYAGLAACSLGANMLEVHVTFSRDCFGPDVPASITPGELRELVRGVRMIETALRHPVDKDVQAATLEPMRRTFGKKVVAARFLKEGQELGRSDLVFKKALGGIPAELYVTLIGKRLTRDIDVDIALEEGDVII